MKVPSYFLQIKEDLKGKIEICVPKNLFLETREKESWNNNLSDKKKAQKIPQSSHTQLLPKVASHVLIMYNKNVNAFVKVPL